MGSLNNDDGDVNENGKNAIGLYTKQSNQFARASRFLDIFLPSLRNYDDHNNDNFKT